MYHYNESGLDSLFLANGYRNHKTPYGEGVSIEDTADLHKAIGKWLVSLPKPLIGTQLLLRAHEVAWRGRGESGFRSGFRNS